MPGHDETEEMVKEESLRGCVGVSTLVQTPLPFLAAEVAGCLPGVFGCASLPPGCGGASPCRELSEGRKPSKSG